MARTVQANPILGKYPKPLIHCTGEPETGKTQLAISFALWLGQAMGVQKCYVWPTDGREHEYAQAIGTERVLAPAANPMDVSAVQDEINADIRAKIFGQVALFSVDTVTHIYRSTALANQLKTMTGQGSSGHSLKAVTMMNLVTVVMSTNVPAIVISHTYEASGKDNPEKKKKRDSISELEEERWKLAFNLKLETFVDEKGFAVIVRECRERPGMQPFIIRDVEGGKFRTMPERIMKALYETAPPVEEAKGWADFGVGKPFPDKGEQFKKNAIREMMQFFVEFDGQKFYAYGDPNAKPTKKSGEPGINGTANHAQNAYTKVTQAFKANGGGSWGQLTQNLKDYTEAAVRKDIEAYMKAKANGSEAEQPALEFELEPEPVGPGALAM